MSATLERLGASAGQATRFVKLLGNQRPALRPALRVPDGQTLTGAIVHSPRSSCPIFMQGAFAGDSCRRYAVAMSGLTRGSPAGMERTGIPLRFILW